MFPGLSLGVLAAIAATSGGALACLYAIPRLDRRARGRHQLALDAADNAVQAKYYLLVGVRVTGKGNRARVRLEYCDVHAAQDRDEPQVRSITLPVSGVGWSKTETAPGLVNFPASNRTSQGTRAILMTRIQPDGIPVLDKPLALRDRVRSAAFNQ